MSSMAFSLEDLKQKVKHIEALLDCKEAECHTLRQQRSSLNLAIDLLEKGNTPTSTR